MYKITKKIESRFVSQLENLSKVKKKVNLKKKSKTQYNEFFYQQHKTMLKDIF